MPDLRIVAIRGHLRMLSRFEIGLKDLSKGQFALALRARHLFSTRFKASEAPNLGLVLHVEGDVHEMPLYVYIRRALQGPPLPSGHRDGAIPLEIGLEESF